MNRFTLTILDPLLLFFAVESMAKSVGAANVCKKYLNQNNFGVETTAAMDWLTEIGFVSNGSRPISKGTPLSLPVDIRRTIYGSKFRVMDALGLSPDRSNGRIDVYFGGHLGQLRVTKFKPGMLESGGLKPDELHLEGDAVSMEYAARNGNVKFKLVIKVDRESGVVWAQYTNRDAKISATAKGNLNQLDQNL